MVFGLGRILYVSLLLINSLAILNEDRFLSRVGWSSSAAHQQSQLQFQDSSFNEGPGVKARMINLIGAVRTLMRIPLIGINTLIIVYEIAWG